MAKATAQRLTEKTMFTELGQLVGTPEYMSPEQAEMSGMDIDTRTDVYLLGMMLYELLAGELPFGAGELRKIGFNEFRRRVLEDEPPRPSTRVTNLGGEGSERAKNQHTDSASLARVLKGDLDWITMKALEKDRTRRYASASELAGDVQRYLNHEPVLASPPSNIYRLRKFARRHKGGVAFGAVLFLVLAGFVVAVTFQNTRIAAERDRATSEASFSHTIADFMLDLFRESNPLQTPGEDVTVRDLLDVGVQRIDALETGHEEVLARLKHTMGEAYYGLGFHKEALPLLREALRTRQRNAGADSLEAAETMMLLGVVLVENGDLAEARRRFEGALAIRRSKLEAQDPEIAASLTNLVSVCASMGDVDQARQYNDEALAIYEAYPDHPSLPKVLTNQAALYKSAGQLDEALPLLERALELRRRHLNPTHHDTARSMERLAHLHLLRREYAEKTMQA